MSKGTTHEHHTNAWNLFRSVIFLLLLSIVRSFTPVDRSALKMTAVDACILEIGDGSPTFAASNDATGSPYGALSNWDVSKIVNMSNIGDWDVSRVADSEQHGSITLGTWGKTLNTLESCWKQMIYLTYGMMTIELPLQWILIGCSIFLVSRLH